MEGVTTAIVLYIFVCLVFPRLIKHRPQFYSAFGLVLLIILLGSWGAMVGGGSTTVNAGDPTPPPSRGPGVIYGLNGLLQIGSIVLLAMSTAGMSTEEMRQDIGKTIEVIRRGGEKETIIVPLKGREASEERGVAAPGPAARAVREPPDMSMPLD